MEHVVLYLICCIVYWEVGKAEIDYEIRKQMHEPVEWQIIVSELGTALTIPAQLFIVFIYSALHDGEV